MLAKQGAADHLSDWPVMAFHRQPRLIVDRFSLYHVLRYRVQNVRMRIGELAVKAEVNIQTLRFYEREGLLLRPVRTASGYRSYAERDLERVRFIRLCQGLGFTLREIEKLLILHKSVTDYQGTPKKKPAAVREIVLMANERLELIDEKIKALSLMRSELTSLVAALGQEPPVACPLCG